MLSFVVFVLNVYLKSFNVLHGRLDEYAGGAILREILMRQRLTFRLANVFINSFPETELSAALQSLDLYAGLPPPAHR